MGFLVLTKFLDLAIQKFERIQDFPTVFATKNQNNQLGHDFTFVAGQERLPATHLCDFNKLIHSA